MEPELIILKPAELILKGRRVRLRFEAQLVRNVKSALKENNIEYDRIDRTRARTLVYTDEIEEALSVLKRVFGIVTLAPAVEIGVDLTAIKQTAMELAKEAGLTKNKTFSVRARRVTKEFKLTSQQINEQVGEFILKKSKAKVNLTQPDIEIDIELIGKRAFLFTNVVKSYGGLPVGTQGKVVCLMSGGTSSAVAAWMMLKRGCEIIPLHIRDTEKEHQKFLQLCEQLQKYSAGHKVKPYSIKTKQDKVLAAEELAKKEGAKAIVIDTQKLKDLDAAQQKVGLPVLTPLIGIDKNKIEKIAKGLK